MRRLLDIKREMLALSQDSDTEMVHDRAKRRRILCEQIIAAYNKLEEWYG